MFDNLNIIRKRLASKPSYKALCCLSLGEGERPPCVELLVQPTLSHDASQERVYSLMTPFKKPLTISHGWGRA